FSSRRRHTISKRDWSSDVCSSDLQRLSSTAHPTALVKKRSKKDAGKNCSICDTIYAAKPKITPMLPDVEPAINKRLNDIFSEGQIGRASCRERVRVATW